MNTRGPEAFIRRINEAAEALDASVRLMEVCGTHTHVIGKAGIRSLLPQNVELISGPGCPVCVTSQADIDRMIALARVPGLVLCTFGDMMRVPSRHSSLAEARAEGADVRPVYSVIDAVELAAAEPEKEVVFACVGFETTAPGIASAVLETEARGLPNLSFHVTHKRVLPAMEAVVSSGSRIHGFLTPGHVSVIVGAETYEPLAREHGLACVATGFEPVDILEGMALLLECLVRREYMSVVQYRRAVKPGGNRRALEVMSQVFDEVDADWRGLGTIARSGFALKSRFRRLDAAVRHRIPEEPPAPNNGCRCGDVLKGTIHPPECGLFGRQCTPRRPWGPCMVSSEGACAARYKYG